MSQVVGLLIALMIVEFAPPAAAQTAPLGEVRGVVRSARTAAAVPLPYAMVELLDAGGRRFVLADSVGAYVLGDVPAGLRRVRALHIGHAVAAVEVLVPPQGAVEVDLELAREPVALPPLTVVTGPITLPDIQAPGLRPGPPPWATNEISLRTLEAGTGMAEAGVTGAAGREGGGNDPADPRDVLLMRGSTTDLKLVLLDGAPVYTPFHLAGLLPSFDATTMGGAALHVGGAPARYDGGLSYILDLRTRPPRRDRLQGGLALDLMSGQASLEGPLGAHAGLLVAGRALHNGAKPIWGGQGSPYGYADGLLRFDSEPAPGHRLGVTAFANQESVYLDLASTLGLVGPDAARWGNQALSLIYKGGAGRTLLDVTAAGSRYRAELPVPPSAQEGASGGAGPNLARGSTDRLRLALDATRPLGRGALRFGGAFDRTGASYGAHRIEDAPSVGADASTAGSVAGAYLDLSARASASVAVRAGLRADRFSSDDQLRWAPRLSVLWNLSDAALLTLAAGRYHQYARASDAQVEAAVGELAGGFVSPPGGPTGPLPVATANHLVLSLDQQLRPGVRLGIQGFLKGFSSIAGSAPSTSSGLDLRVLREGENLIGWLGYSLSWFWSDDQRPGASTSEFTGRHLLSAGLAGRLAGPVGVDLRMSLSEGLPYTTVPLANSSGAAERYDLPTDDLEAGTPVLGGGPADGFLRIDVELYADLLPGWGGRHFSLRPYVKVINALDRRDGLFWYFAPWRDPAVKPLAELSLLPIVGLEWRF